MHTKSGICQTVTATQVASSNGLYVQFCAPDDGRKTRLEHVERLTETNKFEKRCILLVVL